MAKTDLTIHNWQLGISESPHTGFTDMRNVDVITRPGSVRLQPKLHRVIPNPTTSTFTADASTDILTGTNLSTTINGVGYFGVRAVTFSSTGTLPAGLSPATPYHLTIAGDVTHYKVSTTLANANSGVYVNITDAGTGTHTLTTIDPGTMQYIKDDGTGNNVYAVDNNCRVWQKNSDLWYLVSGNTLTLGSGNGLAVYKGYLLVFRNNAIDALNLSTLAWTNSGTGTWNNPLNGGTGIHRTCVGQDDILYWGDADSSSNPYIGSLQQNSGKVFDPTDATTYTITAKALYLPIYKTVNWLAELGTNLMIATAGKEIYPWDRHSATFGLPILCAEQNISTITNINNELYVTAGNRGNVYKYNGYLLQPFKIFPKHLLATDSSTVSVGAAVSHNRELLFTIQAVGVSGVCSLDTITGALVIKNSISTNSYGTLNAITLPALYSDGVTYLVSSWDRDVSTPNDRGLDSSTAGSSYIFPSGYIGYVIGPLIDVGNAKQKRTFTETEVMFDKFLAMGEGAKVYHRTNSTTTWNLLGTFDYSTYGADDSMNLVKNASNCDSIQNKIELTANSNQSTPNVKSVTLRGGAVDA